MRMQIIGKVINGQVRTIVATENRIVGHIRPLYNNVSTTQSPSSTHVQDILTKDVMLFANMVKKR